MIICDCGVPFIAKHGEVHTLLEGRLYSATEMGCPKCGKRVLDTNPAPVSYDPQEEYRQLMRLTESWSVIYG